MKVNTDKNKELCPNCVGMLTCKIWDEKKGKYIEVKCSTCKGTGHVKVKKKR